MKSVKSIQKVTKAMKMVAAAKLRKAQESAEKGRPYSDKMHNIILNLSKNINDKENAPKLLAGSGKDNVHLCVVMTSDRGLCGGFNTNIIKKVKSLTETTYKGISTEVITIGKKANDILKKTHTVTTNNNSLFDDLSFENVAEVAEDLMAKFKNREYDKIVIVYNSFKNAATQIVMNEQFLPLVAKQNDDVDTSSVSDYIFEPSKEEIVNDLIPKSLKTQLFKAIRDSFASEHGARMTAMHKATDNATELRDQLKLTYNKARQASITNEILEIVGGAEALNN